MNRISRNISIILRAERAIARRRMALFRTQTGMMIAAGLMVGIAVVMLNVAGFFALNATYSPQSSALIVAAANLVLAGLLALMASRSSIEAELEPVTEVRDLAIQDLEAEFDGIAQEASHLANDVRRIARDPIGTVLPAMIGPLIAGAIRKNKKK